MGYNNNVDQVEHVNRGNMDEKAEFGRGHCQRESPSHLQDYLHYSGRLRDAILRSSLSHS